MIYAYKNEESNEMLERDFPMGQAPKTITEDGKEYHRFYGNLSFKFGANWFNDGQVKFKRGPIESDNKYT